MKSIVFLVISVICVACGGEAFTSTVGQTDGQEPAADAGTGGVTADALVESDSGTGGSGGKDVDAGAGGRIGIGGDAAMDSGTACLTDLSGVGTGDFSIHFTLTTTESGLTIALLNQRTGCDQSSTFWDVSLSPTAGVVASMDDGSHYVFVEAGNSLNDGKPHKVDVIRRGDMLWYASDGEIHSAQIADPYSLRTLRPLVLGSSACAGTSPATGHVTISEVCITEP